MIPRVLVDREVAHRGLTELHVVESMHERKAKMAELSDGFVALPGGIGTLEELIEVYTWSYLGIHSKPLGLVNTDGYYDGFTAFLDHSVTEGFLRSADPLEPHDRPGWPVVACRLALIQLGSAPSRLNEGRCEHGCDGSARRWCAPCWLQRAPRRRRWSMRAGY